MQWVVENDVLVRELGKLKYMPHNIGDYHRSRKPTISLLDVDACFVKPLSGYNNIERFGYLFTFQKGSIQAVFSIACAFSHMVTNLL